MLAKILFLICILIGTVYTYADCVYVGENCFAEASATTKGYICGVKPESNQFKILMSNGCRNAELTDLDNVKSCIDKWYEFSKKLRPIVQNEVINSRPYYKALVQNETTPDLNEFTVVEFGIQQCSSGNNSDPLEVGQIFIP